MSRDTVCRDDMSFYMSVHQSDRDFNTDYIMSVVDEQAQRFTNSGYLDAILKIWRKDNYVVMEITGRK